MAIIDRRAEKPRAHPPRQRRFEDLPAPNPEEVRSLSKDHPAILERRPMFEKSVVEVDGSDRVLVSGQNNRKIGRIVIKGAWRGFPIYCLTLPERTTCPTTCYMYLSCYGNAMPFARRHRPGQDLEDKIFVEAIALSEKHPDGFVVRLHTLGDFYSVKYVEFWRSLLVGINNLYVYGYTSRRQDADEESRQIAKEIERLRLTYPSRFVIRTSGPKPSPRGATVIDRLPEGRNVKEGLVCPAETDATACCATCGMCWEAATQEKNIVFLRHGMGSNKGEVIAKAATKTDEDGKRQIQPLPNLQRLAGIAMNEPPTLLWVKPSELTVDEAYQRNLSRRSIALISKIVQGWNWTHFKPPIVAKDEETNAFYVLDGQHTAIAAASHPGVDKIPIMVVDADSMKDRARAFIGHNKDRVAVTPCQLHYSAVIAGDPQAVEIDRICREAKVTILKMPPARGDFRPGETVAFAAISALIRVYGSMKASASLSVLSEAKCAPVRADQMRAAAHILYSNEHHGRVDRADIVRAFRALSYEEAYREAMDIAASSAIPRWQALAVPYLREAQNKLENAA